MRLNIDRELSPRCVFREFKHVQNVCRGAPCTIPFLKGQGRYIKKKKKKKKKSFTHHLRDKQRKKRNLDLLMSIVMSYKKKKKKKKKKLKKNKEDDLSTSFLVLFLFLAKISTLPKWKEKSMTPTCMPPPPHNTWPWSRKLVHPPCHALASVALTFLYHAKNTV